MPDDRDSPSAGWREVYEAMSVDPDVEPDDRPCPECGESGDRVLDAIYVCGDHGAWRAEADD